MQPLQSICVLYYFPVEKEGLTPVRLFIWSALQSFSILYYFPVEGEGWTSAELSELYPCIEKDI